MTLSVFVALMFFVSCGVSAAPINPNYNGGISIPDVCKTSNGSSPVPTPYPNTALVADTHKISKKVKVVRHRGGSNDACNGNGTRGNRGNRGQGSREGNSDRQNSDQED